MDTDSVNMSTSSRNVHLPVFIHFFRLLLITHVMLNLCLLSIGVFDTFDTVTCEGVGFTEIDRIKYDEGKKQYELVESKSRMPQYGTCWKSALAAMQAGCKLLTDDIQSRLALAYLNCFLEVQGRPTHECDASMAFKDCIYFLDDSDRGSLTTFFTHTQNICYFLESQVWHEETEKTIGRLAQSSELVADQLETTSELQRKIIERQSDILQNQEKILDTASNLSSSITASSEDIQDLSSDLRKTTEQQKILVKLQSLVLGEISGFYSIIYYVCAMVVAYVITSTARTSSARLWLFFLITCNIIVEWILIKYKSEYLLEWIQIDSEVSEA